MKTINITANIEGYEDIIASSLGYTSKVKGPVEVTKTRTISVPKLDENGEEIKEERVDEITGETYTSIVHENKKEEYVATEIQEYDNPLTREAYIEQYYKEIIASDIKKAILKGITKEDIETKEGIDTEINSRLTSNIS